MVREDEERGLQQRGDDDRCGEYLRVDVQCILEDLLRRDEVVLRMLFIPASTDRGQVRGRICNKSVMIGTALVLRYNIYRQVVLVPHESCTIIR
jgi:hypothetical protein